MTYLIVEDRANFLVLVTLWNPLLCQRVLGSLLWETLAHRVELREGEPTLLIYPQVNPEDFDLVSEQIRSILSTAQRAMMALVEN